MSSKKYYITVMQNGRRVGYVSKLSYGQSFKYTQYKKDALSYTNVDMVFGVIDELTRLGFHQGYVFGYE